MPIFELNINDEKQSIDYLDSDVVIEDRVDLTYSKGSVKRTDEGYLRGMVPVAKVGIMTYMNEDGTLRKELVPEETLFNKDDLKTLTLQPITDSHPKDFVDKYSAKLLKVGMTGETVQRDSDHLLISTVVTDEDAVRNIDSGKRGLSPGYRAQILHKPGTFNGEKYDTIQIKRGYNHLSICDNPRGGKSISLNLDSKDNIQGVIIKPAINKDSNKSKKDSEDMPKINIDGIDYEAAQEVINKFRSVEGKVDTLEAEVKNQKDENTKLQAKNDELIEQSKNYTDEKLDEKIQTATKARLKLLDTAQKVLDEKTQKNIGNMSDIELKKTIILAKSPNANLDEKEKSYGDSFSTYLDSRFDAVVENLDFDPEAKGKNFEAGKQRNNNNNRQDSLEQVQKDSEDKLRNSYQNLPEQYQN